MMHFLYLLNFNIGTGVPHLGSSLTVPAEGKDIVSGLQVLGNLHQVLDGPPVAGLVLAQNGQGGPLRSRRGGALGGGQDLLLLPLILGEGRVAGLVVEPSRGSWQE